MMVAPVGILVYMIVHILEIRPKYREDSAETSTDPVMVSEGNLIGSFRGSR